MSFKILIISANKHKEPYPVYPLGVSYLKTYLVNHLAGCDVEVFDCNLGSEQDLIDKISVFDPKYIGVSFRNVDGANSLVRHGFIGEYQELISILRGVSKAKIIVGGAGFSIFPVEMMQMLDADYGVRGEGEEPFRQLIEMLEKEEDISGREILEDKVNDSSEEVYEEGIDDSKIGICKEDKTVLEIEAVVTRRTVSSEPLNRNYLSSLEVEFEPSLVEYYWKHSGMLNIQTKRGCPYDCIYCSYPVIDGRRVRTLDVDMIVENILKLKRDYGVNYLFFTDSVFNLCNEYNVRFAERLIESGADISWGAYFSPSNISDDEMRLYKASGLTHVEFGTESFSDECLAAYNKKFIFDDVLRTSELCLKHNVYYSHFLILGGYGETPKTFTETIENSKLLKHTVLFPYIGMRIYPHTKLSEIAVAEGVISSKDNLMEPKYYVAPWFELDSARKSALETGKAWIFPDDPQSEMMDVLRIKRNKKGPIWEYLRKP